MFKNRNDAGRKLGKALDEYAPVHPLVLAIPRGGVEVGYRVALHLDCDLSILITRKLPFPTNPESGFGAIAEDGSVFIYEEAAASLGEEAIERIKREQIKEIERRKRVLRKGRPPPEIKGRTIILVDDGIAMGSTMRASLAMCRNRGAAKIVVAAPVSGGQKAEMFKKTADDAVILETPPFFHAVAQVYENWYDVPDEEVISIMEQWR